MEFENFFMCPHCWQRISMVIDLSIEQQIYIEDCEVCCRPIELSYKSNNNELIDFHSKSIEQ